MGDGTPTALKAILQSRRLAASLGRASPFLCPIRLLLDYSTYLISGLHLMPTLALALCDFSDWVRPNIAGAVTLRLHSLGSLLNAKLCIP
eukprot:scaffold64849_cov20-Tisochrysis_lutea.AAC.4